MLRAEDDVGDVAHSEFHPVIALELLALDSLAVYVSSMLASLIDNKEVAVLGNDQRMVARDSRIRNYEVLVDLPPHRERRPIHDDRALLISLNVNQGGKDVRAWIGVNSRDGWKGHEGAL